MDDTCERETYGANSRLAISSDGSVDCFIYDSIVSVHSTDPTTRVKGCVVQSTADRRRRNHLFRLVEN